MARKSREEAARTRGAVIDSAFELGAAEGLENLSIARIADHLQMSKSGVAGHFDSKTDLQLAALERAISDFVENVWLANDWRRPGDEKLRGVMNSWLRYSRSRRDFGGCFLTAASIEFDDRPGPVRDRVQEAWRNWMVMLAAEAKTGGRNGARTVFRLHAIVTEAMWMNQLFGDDRGWALAHEAVEEILS
jgi:AcrR family transcriptional regulator